ncbi:RagB/SusD family nutrient uptake outer membrane protein [Labilibaculum sp.]|uniref:RagB/SusD family nutrient uptake outer membrane protein n=1 Tax=Labilibaculum sp. TaxID=2060723 RepID=UPI0035616E38
MKKNKYIIIGLFALFLGLFGCESDEEFLEEEATTFYTVDNAFSTSDQVDQVLVSIYSHIRDLWNNSSSSNGTQWIYNWKGKGTDMYTVPVIRLSQTFSDYSSIDSDNSTFYNVYTTWYYVIARANTAIYAAELDGIYWSDEDEKAYALAQARFFRAYAYKNLGELFGGVPLVTEMETEARYDYTRSTREETYQYAIDEMEAVLDDLPETTTSGGRIVRGAAQHNLAELYLALGTEIDENGGTASSSTCYEKSIAYADDVIDGGVYSLMTSRFGSRADEDTFSINIYKGGDDTADVVDTLQLTPNVYWDLFQDDNVNYQDGNSECIWAAQVDYDAYVAGDTRARLGYSRAFGPVFRDIASANITGTCENVGGRGVSYVAPTMYTRDYVYEGDYEGDLRNSESVLRRRLKGNVEGADYYGLVVPWDVMYGDSSDEDTYRNNTSEIYPISCKIATDSYVGLDEGEDRSNLFRDNYIVRLSETILLRAEAKQRKGDKSGAADDINLLRARAQCDYMVTSADMDDDFDMILDERARELVYEEARWNTLLRMGGTIAVDRIREYQHWTATASSLNFDYNLWPIPLTVIESNTEAEIEQNPGW